MPDVSVIIPNYNHARYLRQRIDSVLEQTHQRFEVIILDDCSADNSKEIIERYRNHPRVAHIIYNTANSGSTFKQWERGIALAAGRWIWLAESDDYCEPTLLETLLQLTTTNPDVGIAFCRSHWVDANGIPGEELSLFKEDKFVEGAEAVKEMVIHCTVQNASSAIIRKDLAREAIHGLSVYKACGDWVFYTRILQLANLAHSGQQLNYFRWYHANISSKAKERLWATEGVDVLAQLNFRKVHYTNKEFISLLRYWKFKTKHLNLADKLRAWSTVAATAFRYYTTKR